jgi:hypothetical protein
MRIPDPKPARLSERARVLRELDALEKMVAKVRTGMPRFTAVGPRVSGQATLALIETIDRAIELGRRIAARLVPGRIDIYRPSRDVTAFMDVAYAVKADFFQCMRDADSLYPI